MHAFKFFIYFPPDFEAANDYLILRQCFRGSWSKIEKIMKLSRDIIMDLMVLINCD